MAATVNTTSHADVQTGMSEQMHDRDNHGNRKYRQNEEMERRIIAGVIGQTLRHFLSHESLLRKNVIGRSRWSWRSRYGGSPCQRPKANDATTLRR